MHDRVFRLPARDSAVLIAEVLGGERPTIWCWSPDRIKKITAGREI